MRNSQAEKGIPFHLKEEMDWSAFRKTC